MNNRYHRNRIYIEKSEQKIIKNCPIILGGCGIGSVIAECALRLGFEHITIVDGDQVELSNLNRQNYIENDIASNKVLAIKSRLQTINKEAVIKVHNCFITENNIEELTKGHNIAINALDFTTDIPLKFDNTCQKLNIPVIHPFNLGWAGLALVITPKGMSLSEIAKPNENFNELSVVKYILAYLKFWNEPQKWLDDVLEKYISEQEQLPPPQLPVGSWLVASMCTNILFKLATRREIKKFPEFYFSSLHNS